MTRKYPARGVTLLETIIYLGLLSALLAGLIVTTYPIFTNTANNMQTVTAEGEAAFILRKINYMLSDADAILAPGASGPALIVSRTTGSEQMTIRFDTSSHELFFSENFSPEISLVNSRVEITDFKVNHTEPSGNTPRLIEVEFKVDGTPVGPWKKYVHF